MSDAWLIIDKIVASPWGDPGFPLWRMALVGRPVDL